METPSIDPNRVEAGSGFFVSGQYRYDFKLNERGEHFDFTVKANQGL